MRRALQQNLIEGDRVDLVDPIWRHVQTGIEPETITSIRDNPFLRWYMFNGRDYPDFLGFARNADRSLTEDLLARYSAVARGGLDETSPGEIPPNSRTAQHFYYLVRILSLTGRPYDLSILEIGGGYGNLLRMFIQLDCCRSYGIVDIDKISQVQGIYLDQVLSDAQRARAELFNIEDRAAAEALAAKSYDLVLSTFAVTETPQEMRDWYIDNTMTRARFIYITGQEAWRGYRGGEHLSARLGECFRLEKNRFVSDHSHDGPTFELFARREP
jgi:hypothetical protein